jgi:hypothetical protein
VKPLVILYAEFWFIWGWLFFSQDELSTQWSLLAFLLVFILDPYIKRKIFNLLIVRWIYI